MSSLSLVKVEVELGVGVEVEAGVWIRCSSVFLLFWVVHVGLGGWRSRRPMVSTLVLA